MLRTGSYKINWWKNNYKNISTHFEKRDQVHGQHGQPFRSQFVLNMTYEA